MDNPELANAVKPAAIVSEQPCYRSTRTYPNWVLSSTRGADPAFTKRLVAALLSYAASSRRRLVVGSN